MTPQVSQAVCKESFPGVNKRLHRREALHERGSSRLRVSGNLLALAHSNDSGKQLRSRLGGGETPETLSPTADRLETSGTDISNAGANRRMGRRTALQTSRFVRALALVLFFLFPLLSIVQLRDTDAPWRQVATGIRPSVVTLVSDDGLLTMCGVVIQSRPLRVATVGQLPAGMSSLVDGEKIIWSAVLVDTEKQFTILQAETDLHGETAGASSLVHSIPAARLDLEGAGDLPTDVKAALVGARDLQAESLWVGVLRTGESPEDTALYRAHLLRHVSEVASVATSAAWAEEEQKIDSSLRGAPFVDEDGQVVALYLDRQAHRVRALPIEFVSRSLVFLHLQASQ